MEIIGKVKYQYLGIGFWSIIAEDGQKWRPVEMPEALQKKDLKIKVIAEKAENQMSVFMWGTAIDIESYEIISE